MKSCSLFLLVMLCLTPVHVALAEIPDWEVTPSDFELSANVTAVLYLDYEAVEGADNRVGAFVGDDCRGVASPIYAMDSWMFFITFYSNTNGETIHFKAYIAQQDTVLDVEETIAFEANGMYGEPTDPFELHAVLAYDFPPSVRGIPDQTIEVGESFAPVALEDYLEELDGDAVSWTHSGNSYLNVSINAENIATISPPLRKWTGTDSVTFTATDQTENGRTGSDTAAYTILPLDHPPEIGDIPDQTIGFSGTFTPIPLHEYLRKVDGDSIVWNYRFQVTEEPGTPPDWSVRPSDFEMSMTVTARVTTRGESAAGGSHLLGAFVSDGECRGVATPVKALDSWLYFLTLYSNTNGEEIQFSFFDERSGEPLPVQERLSFSANAAYGSPDNPMMLNAGYLIIDIVNHSEASVAIVDSTWHGTETVLFTVTDCGTLHEYSDSTSVDFTILSDHQPVVRGIPDQTIEIGGSFDVFDLDEYVTEVDGDPILWSAAGNNVLSVNIAENNEVTITSSDPAWAGSETILFTATDNTPNGLANSEPAIFTITPVDHPPALSGIPNQTIGFLGSFSPINLNDYLTELDGEPIIWEYQFPPPAQPDDPPPWSVQPAEYELTMNVTAVVISQGRQKGGGDHLLGAFVGEACRGVATPIAALDSWLYFLVVYANTNGEEIAFRFYDAEESKELPVVQKLTFHANAAHGDPQNPMHVQAGFLLIDIDMNHQAHIEIVDTTWTGTETVRFTARDSGTLYEYADSTQVSFTVFPDHHPHVHDIPDQAIEQGGAFGVFDLDEYLEEMDGDSVLWSASETVALQVDINSENEVAVTPRDPEWTGSEIVLFTATDHTANRFADSEPAQFTILPTDHPPEIGDIPDQTIGFSETFAPIPLLDYLTEVDGDRVRWTYTFPKSDQTGGPPPWSVQASAYEWTMSVTAEVTSRGKTPGEGDHLLAAFVQDVGHPDSLGACRGVAPPVYAMDTWQYFLNIYANGYGEELVFRFYDAEYGRIFPVKESLTFVANAIYGSPEDPLSLHAGFLSVGIDSSDLATVAILDSTWTGSESVVFVAADGETVHEYADSAWVTFTVLPDYRPLVAGIPDASISEGEQFTPFDLDDFVTELDGDPIGWSISGYRDLLVSIDESHLVTVSPPDEDWFGKEALIFTVTDLTEHHLSDSDTALFTVTFINDAPVANDLMITTEEDTPVSIVLSGVDVDDFRLTFSVVEGPSYGLYEAGIYTPEADFYGTDSLSYVAHDAWVDSDPARVRIAVTPVNDAPVADTLTLTTEEDMPVLLPFSGSDIEGDTLRFSVVSGPFHGVFEGAAYIPEADFYGTDSLSYVAHDGMVDSDPAMVRITVTPVSDAPVAEDLTLTTEEDTPVSIPFSGSDMDGDTLTFSVLSGPFHGVFEGATYVPEADFYGTDSLTYVAYDGLVDSDPAMVHIMVTPVNDAPEMVSYLPDSSEVTIAEGDSILFEVIAYDVDGDSLEYVWTLGAAPDTVSQTNRLIYGPDYELTGRDTLRAYISDGEDRVVHQWIVRIAVSVVEEETGRPKAYRLSPNYPNPFNPETTIRYEVAEAGVVRLWVYALTGQRVRTLVDGECAVGSYSVVWDGRDDLGEMVASGVYLCRMVAGEFTAVRKMLLIR